MKKTLKKIYLAIALDTVVAASCMYGLFYFNTWTTRFFILGLLALEIFDLRSAFDYMKVVKRSIKAQEFFEKLHEDDLDK